MKRDELLKFFAEKVSDYYYDILVAYTKKWEKKCIFWKRKFEIKPIPSGDGYIIHTGKLFEYIIAYKN